MGLFGSRSTVVEDTLPAAQQVVEPAPATVPVEGKRKYKVSIADPACCNGSWGLPVDAVQITRTLIGTDHPESAKWRHSEECAGE